MPGVLGKGMKTRVECPTDTLWMRGKDMSFANFVTQIASLLEERGPLILHESMSDSIVAIISSRVPDSHCISGNR